MEGKHADLRRSPRLLELARRESSAAENAKDKQPHSSGAERGKKRCHQLMDSAKESNETQSQEWRRTAQRERRTLMNKNERDQALEKRRKDYQMKRARVGNATINEGNTGTSGANIQFAVRTDVGEPNHSGRESISSQDNAIISGNTVFSPRRSPRIAEQVQGREHLDDIEKEIGKKRFHESVDSENES
ncbi:hypothetical protein MKW98_007390 [Papaver atlanticum]|uniref:Uncharacterized protein n=1 Tax=Papaver atlanticum TaxID=357466 RepID=A0AAD4XBJ9_9MAGN|nr:hypothetical protein MKW98_007390 [Papaver atlanticum]